MLMFLNCIWKLYKCTTDTYQCSISLCSGQTDVPKEIENLCKIKEK
ncbi:hypothetical protein E2C01_005140 [Portunus trituberculatus]|uniref:Uncharacterized protein n=1 Tax=Portunus trituberculatus TaxID=210409 RepID=A0A5B7CT78_PORTR|nr:hypothetical protein [Portunus trituberculatus]